MMAGKLFGLGVGPGDPELLTLKALNRLKAAPVIAFFAARGRKGNAFAKAAFNLLASEPWFAGNIEGKDMYSRSDVDIVLCDGFVGNVVLKTAEGVAETIVLPKVPSFVAPILALIPVQLLAYHTAVFMGTDVDQPRNLAKSVTVE